MKEAIAKRWIKALRSNKYKQIKGCLRTEEGFCCLGVLCDLKDKEKWDFENKSYFVDNSGSLPPASVIIWAGMMTKSGVHEGTSLSERNDDGASFEQIADIIEMHWEML